MPIDQSHDFVKTLASLLIQFQQTLQSTEQQDNRIKVYKKYKNC